MNETQNMKKIYYKGARPDGWDFYTGKTLNYRESIGKTVTCDNTGIPKLCSDTVLHASLEPNNVFIGSKIPLSLYRVNGTPPPVVEDNKKSGFKELFVVSEIPESEFNDLFGWNYREAINPFGISAPITPVITEGILINLRKWASVRSSFGVSVRASVEATIKLQFGAAVEDAVRSSVEATVIASVIAPFKDELRSQVWFSVIDLIYAYIGSLFFNIKTWKYIDHKESEYPFQSAVNLWKIGLIPSYDGMLWRLHDGHHTEPLWQGEL
jgi:hypothetical protein